NTDNLQFTDTLPAGLAFIDVEGSSSNVTISAEGSEELSFLSSDVPTKLQDATEPQPLSGDVSGNEVTFTIGDVTNPPADPKVPATVTIEFNALVLNSEGNGSGKLLPNSFTASSGSADDGNYVEETSDPVTATVVEPLLVVDKVVTSIDGAGRI